MQEYIMDVRTEFAESQHNTGDTYVRRGSTNSPQCSGCHTTEGYQYRIANNGATAAMESSSRIGCFACHAPHTNEDFALRKQGPTDLVMGGAGAYDKGNSNTCAMCHQAHEPDPTFVSAPTDTIDSQYWGPHHGPQSNMLSGNGAYVLPGATYASNHPHDTIADGCVGCHMAALPEDGLAGGHSYGMEFEYHGGDHINDNGCATCHAGQDMTARVTTTQTTFKTALDLLAADMEALGWLQSDHEHIDVAAGLTDPDQRGAVYNYLMLLDDRSGGVHNAVYMNAVLSATQSFVDGQPKRLVNR